MPSSLSLQNKAPISSTRSGMMPSEGSSKRIILGLEIIARAIAGLCCSPPDRVVPFWPRRYLRDAENSAQSRQLPHPFQSTAESKPISRFSDTVSPGTILRSSGT